MPWVLRLTALQTAIFRVEYGTIRKSIDFRIVVCIFLKVSLQPLDCLLFPVVPDVLHIIVIFHDVDELFHQLIHKNFVNTGKYRTFLCYSSHFCLRDFACVCHNNFRHLYHNILQKEMQDLIED
jgi:hypothetical protein